jgi:CRISPR/Cas system-associated exonuclease Cas4 (RecB family)
MIDLPPAFLFSQSSLQDYQDCPRRFQLRYVLQQDWPAPVAEPLAALERADSLGKRFHRLMERHWLGLPIAEKDLDPILAGWWRAFQSSPPPDLPGTRRLPEVQSSALVNGQRMTATFDLLAYEPGGPAAIIDWKTSRRRPSRAWLDARLQTIVYPLMLIESAPRLLSYKLQPEDIRLVYWFANAPQAIEVFQYSALRYERDQRYLAALIDQILATGDAIWPLTPNLQRCKLCQYRSLCDRGRVAGSIEDEYTDDVEIAPTATNETPDEEYVL